MPGKSIFLACRSVSNNVLGDLGLTFCLLKLQHKRGGGLDGVIKLKFTFVSNITVTLSCK